MSGNGSPFAAELERLGFKRSETRPEWSIMEIIAEATGGVSLAVEIKPSQQTLPLLGPNEPCFMQMDARPTLGLSMTMAWDDEGQAWTKHELIDLEMYGFTDALKLLSVH